jgi:hypothetical protein
MLVVNSLTRFIVVLLTLNLPPTHARATHTDLSPVFLYGQSFIVLHRVTGEEARS